MDEVLDNSKIYEDIAKRRSFQFNEIERALTIVHAFIIKKKRILYGGMAIDFALKKSGHEGIYQENSIPDYDFFSPDFYNESNELADILNKEGFTNVGAINGAHLTTRRVRVNYEPVADLSYIPQEIYDKLPLLEYKRLNFVHPDFQRMDLHHAFNFPYENPPMEVILHRIKKDDKRFRLLDEYYPIEADAPTSKNQKLELDSSILDTNCIIGGLAAYAVMYQKFVEISKKYKIDTNSEIATGSYEITGKKIIFTIPWADKLKSNPLINILTSDYEKLLDSYKKQSKKSKPTWYNKFLDNIRPRMIIVDDLEIFDTKGLLIPGFTDKSNNQQLQITQPQCLLMYFLQKAFITDSKETREFYRWMYYSTLDIIKTMEPLIPEFIKSKIYNTFEAPFFLTATIVGDKSKNWSSTYIYNVRERIFTIMGIIPSNRPMERPPMGYYPEQGNPPVVWTTNNKEFFQIDGSELKEPFEPIILEISGDLKKSHLKN